jgi:kynurenine formamidase
MAEHVRLIDLSHTIENGLITFKGLPGPVIEDYLSREESRKHYGEGVEFHIGRINMVANTGTYVDAPFHRYSHGRDLSELSLSSLADLDGIVIRMEEGGKRALDQSVFNGFDLRGKAVLIHTGWDAHWGSHRYFQDHPFLTRNGAQWLADSGAALVGVDSVNIDSMEDPDRPVHSILLASGIPIVEHLCNLGELPHEGFRFFAAPPKVKGLGSFPVRAFAVVTKE